MLSLKSNAINTQCYTWSIYLLKEHPFYLNWMKKNSMITLMMPNSSSYNKIELVYNFLMEATS